MATSKSRGSVLKAISLRTAVVLCVLGCEDSSPVPPPLTLKAPSTQEIPEASKIPSEMRHRPSPERSRAVEGRWRRAHPEVTAGLMSGVAIASEDLLLVGTRDGEVFRVEGGVWTSVTPEGILRGVLDIKADEAGSGTAALLDGEGQIWWSDDGGLTWSLRYKQPIKVPPADPVFNMPGTPYRSLVLRRVGEEWFVLAVGGTTDVLLSRDSGKAWAFVDVGERNPLWGGAIRADGTITVVGDRAQIFLLRPESSTWEAIKSSSKEPWRAAAFAGDRLIVGGLKGALVTRRLKKGEGTWSSRKLSMASVTSLIAKGDQVWYAVTVGGDVLETRDAGQRWQVKKKGDGRALSTLGVTVGGVLYAMGPEVLWRGEGWGGRWTELRGEGVETLKDLWIGRGHGVAVGNRGVHVSRRGSGGWSVKRRGSAALTSVAFAGGRFGWMTTIAGEVLKTSDGARTWSAQELPGGGGQRLEVVEALDPKNVFIGGRGGLLYATSDGGQRWAKLELPKAPGVKRPPDVLSVGMSGDRGDVNLWVGGDRGWLWEKRAGSPGFKGNHLKGLNGIRDIEVWGDWVWLLDATGMLLRGGEREGWRVLSVSAGHAWVDVTFGEEGAGLALGHEGELLKTEDGGESWSLQAHDMRTLMTGVEHVSGETYVAVGHGGRIYRTQNVGKTWDKISTLSSKTLTGVSTMKGGVLLACGFEGVCLKSEDGGVGWSRWKERPPGAEKMHVTAQAVSTRGHLALAGVSQVDVRNPSGEWSKLRLEEEGVFQELRRVWVGPAGEVMVVTSTGGVWKRVGGEMRQVELGPRGKALDLIMTGTGEETSGWLSTRKGLYKVFKAEGEFVVADESNGPRRVTRQGVKRLAYDKRGRVWLMGSGGIWSGGGGSWSQVIPAVATTITDVSFVSESLGYASCLNGALMKSEDGGEVWEIEESGTRTNLWKVKTTSTGAVVAVGEGGVVLERAGKKGP